MKENWARENQTRARPQSASAITAPNDADGVWSHLGVPELGGHVAIYDPRRDRMLIFGGDDNGILNYDLWSLSMTDAHPWKKLAVGGTHAPLPRSAVYDPVRDRMIILVAGWYDTGEANDVWTVNLSGAPQWTQLHPAGTKPDRIGPVIYDPVRDRLVMTNGDASVWTLSLARAPAWTQLSAGGTPPGARTLPVGVYDPVRDRMLFWGGESDETLYWPQPDDVWALSLSGTPAWSQVLANGGLPPSRIAAAAIYDSGNDRMIVYGGSVYNASLDDAWSLSLGGGTAAWTQLDPQEPIPFRRAFHTAVYDSKRARMVIYSGWGWKHGPPDRNDVWALALAGAPAWTTVRGTSPEPRFGHQAVYDSNEDRMLIFGGQSWDGYVVGNELWACSLDESPTWTLLNPDGEAPDGGITFYDDVHRRLVVLNGSGVWTLPFRGTLAWNQLTPRGSNPEIRAAILDARHHRVVALGTNSSTWELSLTGNPRWKQTDATAPGPVPGGTAVYDSERDRMLIWEGTDRLELWALPLSGHARWTQLNTTGTPSPRYGYSLIYDEQRDRLVLLNGHTILGNGPGPWALLLSGELEWETLSPPGWGPWAEDGQSAIYDPVHDRMVVFGGRYFYNDLNDAWVLTWGDTRTRGQQPITVTALQPAYPNPANPTVTIPFELATDGNVTLAIYDVAGRRVRTLVDEWTQSGTHLATWDGTGDGGERVASGVYFYRLQAPGITETRKVVMMK